MLALLISMPMMLSSAAWGVQVKLADDKASRSVQETGRKDYISGTMTRATNRSAVINGKEYGVSSSVVIMYTTGEIIKDVKFFQASESAKVRVHIEQGTVQEIIVEGLEQRQ